MSTDALGNLTEELGAAPPASFASLETEQLSLLTEALSGQRASRAAGLGQAAEDSLKLVPALARGPVRKILFR